MEISGSGYKCKYAFHMTFFSRRHDFAGILFHFDMKDFPCRCFFFDFFSNVGCFYRGNLIIKGEALNSEYLSLATTLQSRTIFFFAL